MPGKTNIPEASGSALDLCFQRGLDGLVDVRFRDQSQLRKRVNARPVVVARERDARIGKLLAKRLHEGLASLRLQVVRACEAGEHVAERLVIELRAQRFFVEGLRTDSLMIGPFRQAQVISICAIILGIFLYRYVSVNRRIEAPEKQ